MYSVVPTEVLFWLTGQGVKQCTGSFNANATAELLEKATKGLPKLPTNVFMDGRVANTNLTVTAKLLCKREQLLLNWLESQEVGSDAVDEI